ncbi:MAG: TetR/AcrR family transcriptional regulator [Emcibacter sp.]|nr:TetR/AcrR family transcriptional regulator [Emcibacter sp.]
MNDNSQAISTNKKRAKRGRPKNIGPSAKFLGVKSKLIETTIEQLRNHVYEDVYLQDIAKLTGIQKTALYYYFPSKNHLIYHVFSYWLDKQIKNLQQLSAIKDPKDRITKIIRDRTHTAANDLNLLNLYIFNRPELDDPITEEVKDKNRQFTHMLRTAVETAIKEKLLPDVNPNVAVETMMMPQISVFKWYGATKHDPEKVTNDLLKLLHLS